METSHSRASLGPPEPLTAYFALCDAYRTTPHASIVLALTYPGVTYLALDKGFGSSDLIPLCGVLEQNTVITALDFRRCKIGSSGCYALKTLLERNRAIKVMSLPYNDIGEHGAQALAEGISSFISVTLCISICIHYVLPGLLQNRTLEKLYLAGNRVGKFGCTALATVLRNTSSLKLLDLTNNNIGSSGVKIIAAALNERVRHRASAKQAARNAGIFNGDGAIKVKGMFAACVYMQTPIAG